MALDNAKRLQEKQVIRLTCLVQFANRVDKEAPPEVLSTDRAEDLTERAGRYFSDLSITKYVEYAIKQNTFQLEIQEVFVGGQYLSDEIQLT